LSNRLPNLLALRAFEAAARHGHFGKAGDELFVTHSAVSRHVRALEEDLGVTLFERRNRAVFITDAGKRLLETTRLSFQQIADTTAELRAGMATPLVVSCEPTLTQRWLIPRLPGFQAQHPDITIHVQAAGGPVNLDRDRIDLAIRRSDFTWPPDVQAETIVQERVGPVCAPHYAQERKLLELLATMPRIHSSTRIDAWDRWAVDQGILLPNTPSHTFEHFYLSLEAATAGLGMAIGPEPLVIDALRSGRLVAPFGFSPNGFRYVLLTKTPVRADIRKARFLNWLRAENSLQAN
jgi:LysR family transcriptional regulator, glycine cleavage system transcriptional activator